MSYELVLSKLVMGLVISVSLFGFRYEELKTKTEKLITIQLTNLRLKIHYSKLY